VVSFAIAKRKTGSSELVERFKVAAEENAAKMLEAHPQLFIKAS
jgi:hypothetical protein